MAQRLLTCGVALLILGAGSVSRADPITVIGGSAGFDTGDPPGFHLIFDQGELFGGFFSGGMTLDLPVNSPINCFRPSCQPGGTVNLASEWQQQSTVAGLAIVNGQEFHPFYDLTFSFRAGDAILPPLTDHVVGVNVPFTMDGTIALFLDQAKSTPLLSGTIAGQGTASAEFVRFEGGWAFESHDYLFKPDAPIPESGTLALLVTGAVGTLLLRKRAVPRRRRCGRDEALT
jgi:hypothetical protein